MDDFKDFMMNESTIKPSDSFEKEFAVYCYRIVRDLGYKEEFSRDRSADKIYLEQLLEIIWYKYLKVFKELTNRTFWSPDILEEHESAQVYDIIPLIKLDLNFAIKYEGLLSKPSDQSELDRLMKDTFLSPDYSQVLNDLNNVFQIQNPGRYYSQLFSLHYNIAKNNYEKATRFASVPFRNKPNNDSIEFHIGILSRGIKYPLDNKIFDTQRYAEGYKTNFFRDNEKSIREEFDRLMHNYYEEYGNNFIGILFDLFLKKLPMIQNENGLKSYVEQLTEYGIKTEFPKDAQFYKVNEVVKNAESLDDFDFIPIQFNFDIPLNKTIRLYSTEEFKRPLNLPNSIFYKLVNENIMHSMESAENAVRDRMGTYRVGERWENETRLFNKLKKDLPDDINIYREYIIWADGQKRFDCFIEGYDVAIEYNGEQHYKPIDFFGGKSAYKSRKESDEAKKKYCEENDIELFVIKYDEDMNKRIDEIVEYVEKLRNN